MAGVNVFSRASARHCVFDDTWTAPLARKAWCVNRPGGRRRVPYADAVHRGFGVGVVVIGLPD